MYSDGDAISNSSEMNADYTHKISRVWGGNNKKECQAFFVFFRRQTRQSRSQNYLHVRIDHIYRHDRLKKKKWTIEIGMVGMHAHIAHMSANVETELYFNANMMSSLSTTSVSTRSLSQCSSISSSISYY